MISLTDRFRHDRSAYERPTLGWRCGRAAHWETPCKLGPSGLGICRGENACAPARAGDAWKCRRSAADGGPCANGPGKDGACGLHRPPCAPRRTFAMWRGRVSVLAVGATLALVALLAIWTDAASERLNSLDPGPLSAVHSHFIGASSCATCHTAFGSGATGWWQAFWSAKALAPASQPASGQDAQTPAAQPASAQAAAAPAAKPSGAAASHRLSAACTECHGFGGQEQRPHNRIFERRADLGPTDCLMCHTEHKGRVARVTTLSEAQCQSCHTKTIGDFARSHPDFPASFPYDHPQSTRFNHASHFGKHFTDAASAARVPAGGCIGCHVVGQEGRAIRPANFETTCASCHGESIAKRDFVFFRWPEIETSTIAADEVTKACGVSAEAQASAPATPAPAFSAVSSDQPTSLSAYLLGVPAEGAADYEKPVQDLARAMMSDGVEPLIAAVRDRVGGAKTERLFAGFNAEQARQAACAWAANQEYMPPGKDALSGWRADALDLRYTRPSHADPVVRAWIESVAALPPPADNDDKARLQVARKELLSADGPGQCMKCHVVSGPSEGPQTVSWQVQLRSSAAQTRFDHRPHLNLLGPEKTCTTCHQLGGGAASAATGGLKPIGLATCTECHAAGKVRDDCRTCHVYHQGHAFKKRMVQDAK
ncbi:MAG: hypothetical protein EXQ83_11305 [Xanthobacteraceae bacterium]|nr:hypothetical protein [Xanthobacteraceae bacterium]